MFNDPWLRYRQNFRIKSVGHLGTESHTHAPTERAHLYQPNAPTVSASELKALRAAAAKETAFSNLANELSQEHLKRSVRTWRHDRIEAKSVEDFRTILLQQTETLALLSSDEHRRARADAKALASKATGTVSQIIGRIYSDAAADARAAELGQVRREETDAAKAGVEFVASNVVRGLQRRAIELEGSKSATAGTVLKDFNL